MRSVRKRGALVAACGVCAACDGFGFARNTATTFDIFYWLQVKNFDVRLLNSAPNRPDYIDIVGLCLHAPIIPYQRPAQPVKLSSFKFSARYDASLLPKRSASAPARCITENNSDASGHEQKLNVSKLPSKMSLRCWTKCKRPTIPKSFGSSSTRRNLRSKQRSPQRKTERERNLSPGS